MIFRAPLGHVQNFGRRGNEPTAPCSQNRGPWKMAPRGPLFWCQRDEKLAYAAWKRSDSRRQTAATRLTSGDFPCTTGSRSNFGRRGNEPNAPCSQNRGPWKMALEGLSFWCQRDEKLAYAAWKRSDSRRQTAATRLKSGDFPCTTGSRSKFRATWKRAPPRRVHKTAGLGRWPSFDDQPGGKTREGNCSEGLSHGVRETNNSKMRRRWRINADAAWKRSDSRSQHVQTQTLQHLHMTSRLAALEGAELIPRTRCLSRTLAMERKTPMYKDPKSRALGGPSNHSPRKNAPSICIVHLQTGAWKKQEK